MDDSEAGSYGGAPTSALQYTGHNEAWIQLPAALPVVLALACGAAVMLVLPLFRSAEERGGHVEQASPHAQHDRKTTTCLERPPPMELLKAEDLNLERTGECVICLGQIRRSAIGSCPHHFCAACLLECCRRTPRCPRCQTVIRAVWLDPEYDAVLRLARKAGGSAQAESDTVEATDEVEEENAKLDGYIRLLRLPLKKRFAGQVSGAGLTLKTCLGRPGVVCAAMDERDMAYRCGFRVGDVIVSMNGTPCWTHRQSIALLNRLSKAATQSEDARITCLVIPGVGLLSPVLVPSEPWEADEDDVEDEEDVRGRLVPRERLEDADSCAIL
jgi:hypothetical protein